VDRNLFFGRESTINALLVQVLLSRLVVLFGESGAGKSSLVNAGLIPVLEKEGLSCEKIRVRPIAEEPVLIERVKLGDTSKTEHFPSPFGEDKPTTGKTEFFPSLFGDDKPTTADGSERFCAYSLFRFEERLRNRCSGQARPGARQTVLIFDQFEELFTLFAPGRAEAANPDQDLQVQLINCLTRLVTDQHLKIKAIIVIREDFLAKLDILAKRYPQVFDHRVRLGFLKQAEAQKAILGPFGEKHPFPSAMDPDLAQTIVKDLLDSTIGSEPDRAILGVHPTQLQIICSRLWAKYAGSQPNIGLKEYKADDGVKGILEGFLKSELAGISSKLRATSVKALKGLITDAETRDVVSYDRLRQIARRSARAQRDFEAALAYLEARRLIYKTSQRETFYYEIASEYLIPAICREAQELELNSERKIAFAFATFCLVLLTVLIVGSLLARRRVTDSESKLKDSEAWAAHQSNKINLQQDALSFVTNENNKLRVSLSDTNSQLNLTYSQLKEVNRQLRFKTNELANKNREVNEANSNLVQQTQQAERLRLGSKAQALALESLRLHGDARAVLLARQAFLFNVATNETVNQRVDEALRAALSAPTASTLTPPARAGTQPTIWAVAFHDKNALVLAAARDGTLYSWPLSAPNRPPAVLIDADEQVTAVALGSDAQSFARRLRNGSVQFFTLNAVGKPPTILSTPEGPASFLAFSANNQFLLCGLGDRGTILLWDVADAASIPKRLDTGSNWVTIAACSVPTRTLATADMFGPVRLWSTDSLQPASTPESSPRAPNKSLLGSVFGFLSPASSSPPLRTITLEEGTARITTLTYNPGGDQLAVADADGKVELWDRLPNGRENHTRELRGPNGPLSCLAYDRTGRRLAAGGWDGVIRVWDPIAGSNARVLLGHQGGVPSICFSADGKHLLSSGLDQTVRLWDLAEAEDLPTSLCPSVRRAWETTAFQAAMSTDGSASVAGDWDGRVRISRLTPGGGSQNSITLPHDQGAALSLCLNSNGQYLAVGSYRGTVRLYDLRQTNSDPIAVRNVDSPATAVTLSSDGTALVAANLVGSIRVWRGLNWNSELPPLLGHKSGVVALSVHPSGRFLASGSWDGTLRFWSLDATNRMSILSEKNGIVSAVAFSPDGQRLASGVLDGAIQLWRLSTPPVLECQWPAQDARILCLAFSSDSRRLAAGSWDKSVRVWNIISPRPNPLYTLREQGDRVLAVAFRAGAPAVCSSTPNNIFIDWLGPTEELANQVCAKTTQNLSFQDWQQFVGGDYERTCENLPPGSEPMPTPSTQMSLPNSMTSASLPTAYR
jgi:WD40 repeat protein